MQTEARGGLREAKKRATRDRLISAARRLTLEHGLDGVTVEMISSEVGVSVRTFHNYFPAKDDALVGDQPTLGTPASTERFLAGGPTGGLLTDLMHLLDPGPALQGVDRDELRLAHAVALAEPRVLARQLAHAMAQESRIAGLVAERRGLDAADPSCRTVAALALTVLRRAVTDWITGEQDDSLQAHLDAGTAAALHQLGPDPRRCRTTTTATTRENP